MKHAIKYLFFLLIVLSSITCKKEQIQPGNTIIGSPVFSFNGTVNNQPVSIQAGVDNYYMYSSYSSDTNNLLNFTGALQQIGCTSCANSISITIKDYKIENSATIDSSFNTNPYYYTYQSPTGGSPVSYSVTYTPHIGNGNPNIYIYNFGDGRNYTGDTGTQTHIYHTGAYNVLLKVNFTGGTGSTDTIQNFTQAGTPSAALSTIIRGGDTVLNGYDSNLIVSFSFANSGGTSPYTYQWNFGDENDSSQVFNTYTVTNILHTYAYTGLYHVTEKTTDVNNLTSKNYINVVASHTANTSLNYIHTLSSVKSPVSNPEAFSNVTITYTDASGVVYSSANIVQPASSIFLIQNISSYQNNTNNQTTKKLQLQFNCIVKNSAGMSIPITNGNAVIAVAYK